MKKLIILILLFSNAVFAARLEDVRILNVIPGQGNLKLKLQTKDGPTDSYFFLDITKSDPDSIDKLGHVINKIMHKDKYRLNLNIPSFSSSPSGSYYRSNDITFSGTSESKSNLVSPKKKKN